MAWRTIERFDINEPIWVIKYDMFYKPTIEGGGFCASDYPGARKFTSCHGWYEDEETAMKVLRHFPIPNSYRIEKVNKRVLKDG